MIPLAEAHRSGASAWSTERKQAFASDIAFDPTHIPVGQGINQAKGSSRPDEWKPPLESAWCTYAVDWVAVKHRWGLSFTPTEKIALHDMLDTCLAGTATAPLFEPKPSTPNPVAPTTTTNLDGDNDGIGCEDY